MRQPKTTDDWTHLRISQGLFNGTRQHSVKKVTIGVVNYNGKETLSTTLQSIQQLKYPDIEVMMVDNHSTDDSVEWVQTYFPKVRCIRLDSNPGPAAARNVILQQAQTDYVFIMDNDIILDPEALTRLMQIMEKVPNAAACHPEICDTGDPALAAHYNGGWIHYLCALVPRTYNGKARPEFEVFDVVSGGAMLINRKVALQIAGFDEDYFFNWEDGDFMIRFTLAGYLCVNVPGAVVYHRFNNRGTSKVFYQIRNRWYFILKLYSWRTLLLASPMMFLFEISQAIFLSLKGAGKDYWRGNLAALAALPAILRKRRVFQKLKVKRDRDWLRSGDLYLPNGLFKGKNMKTLTKFYSSFFNLYWRLIRPFC